MRCVIICFIFCLTVTSSHGQSTRLYDSLALNNERNLAWITSLKSLGKGQQWNSIRDRLSYHLQNGSIKGKGHIPTLIIDGYAFNDITSDEAALSILKSISPSGIKSLIMMDKLPDKLYIDKTFNGWIIIVLKDRKLSKTIKNLY
jgi:hypothetical protein